jgi:hypothetical protein
LRLTEPPEDVLAVGGSEGPIHRGIQDALFLVVMRGQDCRKLAPSLLERFGIDVVQRRADRSSAALICPCSYRITSVGPLKTPLLVSNTGKRISSSSAMCPSRPS